MILEYFKSCANAMLVVELQNCIIILLYIINIQFTHGLGKSVEYGRWGKMERKSNWKYALQQHNYTDLDHFGSKKLYFELSSVIISDNCGDGEAIVIQEYNEFYNKPPKKSSSICRFINRVKKYKIKKSQDQVYELDKKMYFENRRRTQKTISRNMPETILFQDERTNFKMSQLLLLCCVYLF